MAASENDDDDDRLVRKAIKYADKWAEDDDEAFIQGLNQFYAEELEKTTGPRARDRGTVRSAGEPPKSFQIEKDPRYLKNARELARRTLGGDRILGGKKVKPSEFLDCVAVGSDNQWGCSGTLIGSNVVVTAGHCAEVATRVFFGHDVTKKGIVVGVTKRVRHPKYHKGARNDLLVLLLDQAIPNVAPRPIASKSQIDKATDGRAVGFGNTDPRGMFGYGVKRQVDVPVASPACTGKVDGRDDHASYGCDKGLEIVAGRPLLARDSCTGDSGGPFYIQDKKIRWFLAGATSRATDSAQNNCGDGGIYVRVDQYLEWIESIPGVNIP